MDYLILNKIQTLSTENARVALSCISKKILPTYNPTFCAYFSIKTD